MDQVPQQDNSNAISALTAVLEKVLQTLVPQDKADNKIIPIKIRPPAYSGKDSEDLDGWLFKMNNMFEAKKMKDHDRIISVANFLDGAALAWFRHLLEDIENGQKQPLDTWEDFVTAIRLNFDPPNLQQLIRTQLRQLKQGTSLSDYIIQFRTLLSKITDMSEDDRIHYFVSGLKQETRSECDYRTPDTLVSAIQIAQNFDHSKYRRSNSVFPSGKSNFTNQPYAGPAASRSVSFAPSPPETVPMEIGTIGLSKTSGKNRYCSFHKSSGHSTEDCRARNRTQSPTNQSYSKPILKNNNNSKAFQLEETYLQRGNGQTYPLTVFSGLINGRSAQILVDSGSSCDHVSTDFAKRSGLSLQEGPIKQVVLADGSMQQSNLVVYSAPLQLGTLQDQVTFRVLL